MKNGKRQTLERKSNKRKSRGTAWAERTRAQCNTLTTGQREKLLDRALKIAYATRRIFGETSDKRAATKTFLQQLQEFFTRSPRTDAANRFLRLPGFKPLLPA